MRGKNLYKHGMTGTPEHRSWLSMITRCYGGDKSRDDFKFYAGKGITVCERWRESFLNFYADMGPKPTTRHSIDRVNSSLGYSPENCRWADPKEQRRNQHTVRVITYMGRSQLLTDWAREIGIHPASLHERLQRTTDLAIALAPRVSSRVRTAGGRFAASLGD